MSLKFHCIKCSRPLEPLRGAGRPPSYCSVVCKRAAGYEIRRIRRHLERLEMLRISLASQNLPIRDCFGRTLEEEREDNARAIAELEKRLAALLQASEA